MERPNWLYESYPDMFREMRQLAQQYGDLPTESVMSAYGRAYRTVIDNPYIQNRRVKSIPTLPADYSAEKIADMLQAPQENEKGLREVSHDLEWGAYPYFKIRKTYQDINEDFWYVHPAYIEKGDASKPDFKRDFKLAYRVAETINPAVIAHQIRGEAVTEGKTFYTPRFKVDKSHGKVDYAFLQRLPSDYCKIVGYNNLSKYTVAFDMTYFLMAGNYPEQFGNLFDPYFKSFKDSVDVTTYTKRGSAANYTIDTTKIGSYADVYSKDGRWMYWVTLPPEKVWTFEIDDTGAVVAPTLAGLFQSMASLSKFEDVQMELVSAPLVAVLTGEIPYFDEKQNNGYDAYKLSPSGRAMYERYWYDLMAETNTGGVGFFTAPVSNIKLHQLQETPSAINISTSGYSYALLKSGLGSIIPISDNPRAGVANLSVKLESKYCVSIYNQFERFFSWLFKNIGLRYEFCFKMFGDIYSKEDEEERIVNNLKLGLLPEIFRWYALKRISPFDDEAMSAYISDSGLMDLRIPMTGSIDKDEEEDKGQVGRPTIDFGDAETDGQEDDLDNG